MHFARVSLHGVLVLMWPWRYVKYCIADIPNVTTSTFGALHVVSLLDQALQND